MKKKLLLFAGLFSIAMHSFATVHVIQTGTGAGTSFSPASITNVHPGDTVMWKWTSGTHTTTSKPGGIPGTALAWNHTIASANDSFMYVPTVTGPYNYKCTPHEGMGMVGSFNVVPATSVASVAAPAFSIYPNPASNRVQLVFGSNAAASVTLTDITGRVIKTAEYSNIKEASFGLDGVANGIYFIRTKQGNELHTQQLVVAH